MHVAMVGLSHKTAPVEQREKASLSDREARTLLRELVAFDDIAEAVALSTCNRTELYLASDDPQTAQDLVVETLLRHSRISREELSCARYQERDDRAAAQLFRVASGLDSMVVGESEIQGQVRAAWERAYLTTPHGKPVRPAP